MAAKNPVTYVNHLREAGSIRNAVSYADEILAEIARLERALATRKKDLRELVKATSARASAQWTAEEIAQAKADASSAS